MNNDCLVIRDVICQSLSKANHLTRDQKSLFTVTDALFFITSTQTHGLDEVKSMVDNLMKTHVALISTIMIKSGHNFAHVTTAELS